MCMSRIKGLSGCKFFKIDHNLPPNLHLRSFRGRDLLAYNYDATLKDYIMVLHFCFTSNFL